MCILINYKELEDGRAAARLQEEQLKHQTEFLERLLENNREVVEQIEVLNGETASARKLLQAACDDLVLTTNESVTTKKLSQNVTNRLQQQRQKNRMAAKDVIDKEDGIERGEKMLGALQAKLKRFSDKNWDAQERLRSLDEMVETEEKNMAKIATENARLGGSLFRLTKVLNDLKSEQKVLEVNMSISKLILSYKF